MEVTTVLQAYTRYKKSRESWLGDIPEHWEEKKFKHIFSEKKKTTNVSLNCGSISFGKVVYKDDEKIPESTKRSYQVLSKGEFLINPLNLNYDLISLRIALSDKDVVVSSGYIILNNNLKLNKEYFKWLLHIFDVVYMKTLGSGVRQTLSFTHIANCELVFPPLEEQNKMAQFLEIKTTKVEQAISIKQKQIELLKERRQILIHKAVTRGLNENVKLKDSGVEWIGEIPEHWKNSKIKAIAKTISGATPPSGNILRYYNGEYPWIRTTDLNNGILNEVPEYITEAGLRDTACKIIPKYTICIAMYGGGGTIGKFALVNFENATLNQAVCGIIGNIEINYLFLYYSLQMMRKHWMFYADGSRKDPNISQDIIKNMPIVYPNLKEQKRIVEYIETSNIKIATAIFLKEQEIEKLKEYKMSLIDSVVTGKAKVC